MKTTKVATIVAFLILTTVTTLQMFKLVEIEEAVSSKLYRPPPLKEMATQCIHKVGEFTEYGDDCHISMTAYMVELNEALDKRDELLADCGDLSLW